MTDSAPLRVGLLGHRLGHSLSPAMQDAAFEAAGLPHRYELIDVAAGDLPARVAALRTGWLGCNVTVPYKSAVAPLLDELRGEAAVLGAVNTVAVEGTKLIGYNTDVFGFADDLATHEELRRPRGMAVVLGAGGAARAVVYTLLHHGWTVHLLARRPAQAEACRTSLPDAEKLHPGPLEDAARWVPEARLLVNCTPAGMWPHTAEDPLPAGVRLPSTLFVYDLIYRPLRTRLLTRAATAGCATSNGLGMLVAQGAAAFTIWTGRDSPRRVMRAAAERALLAAGEDAP